MARKLEVVVVVKAKEERIVGHRPALLLALSPAKERDAQEARQGRREEREKEEKRVASNACHTDEW